MFCNALTVAICICHGECHVITTDFIGANVGNVDWGTIVSTLMIWLSAIMATGTTIFAGGFIDKMGKRKPFVAYSYIAWGAT